MNVQMSTGYVPAVISFTARKMRDGTWTAEIVWRDLQGAQHMHQIRELASQWEAANVIAGWSP